jgi:pyruvate/2-oxoglutarate dehydrogenase complex dihydrolipoamide acyltransferase (E2) component
MAAMDLARMVPGFDFLQGLLKNAGAGLPSMGQWVAPTLDPEELEKRIAELKTVQFWLEQNAKLMATTIQAMEVQRMTLATLKSMNLPLADLANTLQIKVPGLGPGPDTSSMATPAAAPKPAARSKPAAQTAAQAAAPAVDPMQWWGALTQQFTQLATQAMKDSATDVAKSVAKNVAKGVAGAVVKQSLETAGSVIKKATASKAAPRAKPARAARSAAVRAR